MSTVSSAYTRFFVGDMTKSDILVIRNTITKDWPLHWHDCFEIEMVLSGNITQEINGELFTGKKGDLFFFSPIDFHSIHLNEPTEIFNIMFPDSAVDISLLTSLYTCKSKTHFLLDDKTYDYFCCMLSRATEESATRTPYYENITSNTINTIVAILLRECQSDNVITRPNYAISQALLYIHQHFSENPGLQRIAEAMHMNYAYFSVLFHKEVGMTFKQYITKLKLAHAKKKLTATDLPITDICFSCGFESLSNFHREFKKEFGNSPASFRKNSDTRENSSK